MSFFNKKDSDTQESTINTTKTVKPMKTSGDVITSIISNDMKISGEVNFKGKARIDGLVEGNIHGDHLVLSETGRVNGDLELTSLICQGSIEGNVKAQQVTAHSSASIRGNLIAQSLTVESGAKLNGEVSSSSQPNPQQQPKAPSAAAVPKAEPEKKETAPN